MPHIVRKTSETETEKITCGIARCLTSKEDFADMDFAHITITDSTKEHYHKKLTEAYFVLKGSIAVELDGVVENLEVGDLILIHPNTNHKAWKTSEEDAEILVVCSPPWSQEDEITV
jgi:mannose-6-phosphate isomerase-like protein (cupin superfamily)